jgi:broad specificity phosphatase PhoE
MENFREVNVGDLERQPPTAEAWAFHNRVLAGWLNGQPEVTFPGGENYFTLWNRVRSGIEQIVAGREGCNLLVVGHGGIFTLPMKDLCPGVDVGWLVDHPNHNCSITEIEVETIAGRLRGHLVQWASYTHLHGPAADLVPGVPQPGELPE